jgi:hypothetical protein
VQEKGQSPCSGVLGLAGPSSFCTTVSGDTTRKRWEANLRKRRAPQSIELVASSYIKISRDLKEAKRCWSEKRTIATRLQQADQIWRSYRPKARGEARRPSSLSANARVSEMAEDGLPTFVKSFKRRCR